VDNLAKEDVMTISYSSTHLTLSDRITIQEWVDIEQNQPGGRSQAQLARDLGVHPSTISRELTRNSVTQMKRYNGHVSFFKAYFAHAAHQLTQRRHQSPQSALNRFDHDFWSQLVKALTQRPRIESVDSFVMAYKLAHLNRHVPSTTTVYRYIDQQLIPGIRNIDLPRQTTRKTKTTRSRPKGQNKKHLGISISQRPQTVLSRTSFGDWEADLVKGIRKKHHAALVVMIERKSRLTLIQKIADYQATTCYAAVSAIMSQHANLPFNSITFDNGAEFASMSQLPTQVYFCHAYSSWERGSNEQLNGLLREYIPKGKPIEAYNDEQIESYQSALNHKHRRVLGYQTAEALAKRETNLRPTD
jgi:IS30 family transposase